MKIVRPETAFSVRTKKVRARLPDHLERVAGLGCIVCADLGYGYSPAEIHHIKFQTGIGRRAGDKDTIPLCPIHHRTGGYGVAYHAGPGAWEHRYGRQTEMLERVREMLR